MLLTYVTDIFLSRYYWHLQQWQMTKVSLSTVMYMYMYVSHLMFLFSDGLSLLLQDLQPEERFRVPSASEPRRWNPTTV